MPTPPVDTPVSATGQLVMTIVTVCALVGVLVAGVRMARGRGSAAPLVLLAGSLLAGFIETLYCLAFHLWYYVPGQWSIYSSMGRSLPVWAWMSYCPFYGGLALWTWNQVDKGATRAQLFRLFGVLVVIGIITEFVCIGVGTYEYYGPHPFRVLNFPIWIAVANASIGIVAGVLAARLHPLLRGRQVLALVALVPAVMTMVQFGTGFLALDVINTENPPSWLMYLTATASMALAVTVAWLALRLVPATRPAEAETDRAMTG